MSSDDLPRTPKDIRRHDPRQKWWLLAMALALAVPAITVLAITFWRAAADRSLFDDLPAEQVARLVIMRHGGGNDTVPLVLERRAGGWVIASAGDAPADGPRIEATIKALAALHGPLAEGGAKTPATGQAERLEVRLDDGDGRLLGAIGLRDDMARRLPDGPALTPGDIPALADWPSAWTTLKAPAIAVNRVVAVEQPAGDRPGTTGIRLSPEAVGQTVAMLLSLTARDFAVAGDQNWSAARRLRVVLDDGAVIYLEQVPDGKGRYLMRLSGPQAPGVDQVKKFAFRVEKPLPQLQRPD